MIALTRSERARLERLAHEAGTDVRGILRAVLRDGLDYTEYKIRAINEGLADFSAGRVLTLDEMKSRITRRRADRGRARRKAA